MPTYRNLTQNARLHALVGKLGINSDMKADMVEQYTGGRTRSTADMYTHECQALINFLSAQVGKTTEGQRADKMRKKIISMAHEMGWQLPNGKADIARVNAWCKKYGHGHKPLNSYQYKELPELVGQFEEAYKYYLKTI